MECEICGSEAVISTNNGTLCADHFKQRFEEIALSTIKKYKLIEKGEKIAVANSGGKDSLSLLYILSHSEKGKVLFWEQTPLPL